MIDPPRAASAVRIDWCGPDAAATVHRITQAAFAPQVALDPPSRAVFETEQVVREDLAAGRGILAEYEGAPVGAARVVLHPEGGYVHLRRLAVLPDRQHRGIGRAIMLWLHREAAALGDREVRLGVRHALPANRAMYAALGYQTLAQHEHWSELRLLLPAISE